MNTRRTLYILSLLFLTTGCHFLAPDTPAFQDEFTREFMKSPKEVEDGFYLFESKTGGYTMLFPVDATLDEGYYLKQEDAIESISFGKSDEDINMSFYVDIRYENLKITEWIDPNLTVISESVGYTGDYEEFEHNDKTHYYAKNEFQIDLEDKSRTRYRFFSYIKSKDHPQGIQFLYNVGCLDDNKACPLDVEQEEEKALKLMKSIEFK